MVRLKWSAMAALVAATLVLFPNAAYASVVSYDLSDLVARSASIVEAHVADAESYKEGASAAYGRLILTDTELRVTKVLKGSEPSSVTVTQPGGAVGTERLVVTELPTFVPGERCILFLNAGNDVVGGYQGKLGIIDGEVPSLGVSLQEAERQIRALAEQGEPVEPPAAPGAEPSADPTPSAGSAAALASVPEFQVAGEGPAPEVAAATIYSSGFEDGTASGWTLAGSPTWAVTAYRAKTGGSYSLYGSGGGTGGVPAPGPCPAGTITSYATRTFSTSGYNTGTLEYDYYTSMTSSGGNWLGVAFSTTGAAPWYFETSSLVMGTSAGWQHKSIDLRQVTDYFGAGTIDLTGRSTVYVRFVFQHNTGAADEGVYVDNVALNADNVTLPAVSSITPSGANAGVGTTVTITGANFGATQGAGSVRFLHGQYMNGTKVNAPIVSWSDTQIVCQVPRYAQSGTVTVTNSAGVTAAGYTYQVGFSTGGLHVTSLPFTYRVNENCGDLTGEGAAIQAAFPTWSAAGSSFRLAYGGTCSSTTNPPSTRNFYNDVYFASSGFSDAGILAWNLYWYSGTEIVESDIVFNDAHSWADGAVSGRFDVQSVALHELGHTVGLDDQYANTTKVMGAASTASMKRALTQSEIDGAVHLYGSADSTPPAAPNVASTSHPTQGQWYSNDMVTFAFSASDASGIAGYSWALDQQPSTMPDTVSEGTGTTAGFSACPDGTWYFHVRAKDGAGNWGAAAHYAVKIDTEAPTSGCEQDGSVSKDPVFVQLDAADGRSGVASIAYGIDSAPTMPYTGAFAVTGNGVHVVKYRATDAAGNVEDVRTATITLDTVAPSTIASAPAGWVQAATVELAADDPGATTTYRIGGGGWISYENPIEIAEEGVHLVEYFSTDQLGNAEEIQQCTVRVDATGPTASSDAAASYDGTATITLSASDALSGVSATEFNVDGAGWTEGSKATVSAPGEHVLQVRARDFAGNVGAAVSYDFRVTGRVEETDARIVFDGAWQMTDSATKSGGAWAYAYTPGAAAYVTFRGTGIDLISSKAAWYGIAKVTLDGTTTSTVDLYAPSSKHQQTVWSVSNLPDTVHTLKFEWTGQKNPAASKADIGIDAFEIDGAIRQGVVRYEQGDGRIAYTGVWSTLPNTSRSGGSWAYTYTPEAGAYVAFKGTAIDLVTSKSPAYGIAKVTLDGGAPALVDLYAANSAHVQKVWGVSALSADTTHTVAVEWTGTKNPASTKPDFGIDAFEVAGRLVDATPPKPTTNRFEQTDPRIVYDGTWSTLASSLRSGSSWAYANAGGSVANVAFDGTKVALVASKTPSFGIAKVTLDGGAPAYVDLYSASSKHQQRVFVAEGLSAGQHTLRVEWTGTKNNAATTTDIGIDAVETDGTLVQAVSSVPPKTRFETTDPRVVFSGAWAEAASSTKSGGSWAYTYSAGSAAQVSFTGTAVDLISSTSAAYGIARVTLDGGAPVYVDLYSASSKHQQKVWGASGLAPGAHTLSVEWTGTRNAASSKSDFGIDAIDVAGTLN